MKQAAEAVELGNPDEVPAGWRRTTLGEIGVYINGRGFKKSEWSDSGLPIIRIQNLTGTGKEQNYYNGPIDERHVVDPGDLLISWAATLGAYLWSGPRAAVNQHIFKVRSFVDRKFHYYLMQHILSDLYRQTHGSGMVHITKSKFDSIPILVPESEAQQKGIVAEIELQFSRLDEAVANLKRVKANLKRYKAAVLKAAVEGRLVQTEAELARREGRSYESGEHLLDRIRKSRRGEWRGRGKYREPAPPDVTGMKTLPEGWVWASLGSLGDVVGGLTKNPKRAALKTKLPYLRVANVYANELRLDDIEEIGVDDGELDKLLVQKGDLLIVEGNGSPDQIGRLAIWDASISPCVHQNHLIKVRLHRECLPEWVMSWLMSPDGRDHIRRAASSTSGLYTLSVGKVADLLVPLPPAVDQHRMVAELGHHLSILPETDTLLKINLQRADRLRQAMLHQSLSPTAIQGNMRTECL